MLPVVEAAQGDNSDAGLAGYTQGSNRSCEMPQRLGVLTLNEKNTLRLQRSREANVELGTKGRTEIREFGLSWRGYGCPTSLIYPAHRLRRGLDEDFRRVRCSDRLSGKRL